MLIHYLAVFYKPYESRGQAWPITFIRLIWGVVIFQIFMVGFFLLKKAYIISTIMVSVPCFVYIYSLLTHAPYLDPAPRIHRHLDVVGRPHVGAAFKVR